MKTRLEQGFYAAAGIGMGWLTFGFGKAFLTQPERFSSLHSFSISAGLAVATIFCGNLTEMCIFEQSMKIPSKKMGFARAIIGAVALFTLANI